MSDDPPVASPSVVYHDEIGSYHLERVLIDYRCPTCGHEENSTARDTYGHERERLCEQSDCKRKPPMVRLDPPEESFIRIYR